MASSLATRSSRGTILESARRTLASNPGASLTEIALRAGVGRTTLHRYFPSREELVREISREALAETERATAHSRQAKTAREALEQMLEGVIPLGDRYHFLASEAVGSAWSDDLAELYRAQIREVDELVDWLKGEGVVAHEVPRAWVTTALEQLVWGAWSAVQDGSIAAKDAPGLVIRTLLRGLEPDS